MIEPRIETLLDKKLVGQRISMSLAQNKTHELWRSFTPRRNEIINTLTSDLISMQIYPPDYFTAFSPVNQFVKWAAVEVSDFEHIPHEMEAIALSGGLYAVFDYKGSSADSGIFQYIFGTWLPQSSYRLDNRPHVEVLGPKYKNNDPSSEEEIWIPIFIG